MKLTEISYFHFVLDHWRFDCRSFNGVICFAHSTLFILIIGTCNCQKYCIYIYISCYLCHICRMQSLFTKPGWQTEMQFEFV